MKRLGLPNRSWKNCGALPRASRDPVLFQRQIFAAARSVAAGHDPPWADFHALRGSYGGYWSFKPLPDVLDLIVICVPLRRVLLLSGLGSHDRFFTPGRKTVPPKAASLREVTG